MLSLFIITLNLLVISVFRLLLFGGIFFVLGECPGGEFVQAEDYEDDVSFCHRCLFGVFFVEVIQQERN